MIDDLKDVPDEPVKPKRAARARQPAPFRDMIKDLKVIPANLFHFCKAPCVCATL